MATKISVLLKKTDLVARSPANLTFSHCLPVAWPARWHGEAMRGNGEVWAPYGSEKDGRRGRAILMSYDKWVPLGGGTKESEENAEQLL